MVHQSLAVDISLAALLGENVYNFGELLLHPIVRTASRSDSLPPVVTSSINCAYSAPDLLHMTRLWS